MESRNIRIGIHPFRRQSSSIFWRGNMWSYSILVSYLFIQSCLGVTFCPSHTPDNPKCIANSTQYKCGVFFENLPDRPPLSWIGALPDIFSKKSVADSPSIRQTLNGATPESFNLSDDDCDQGFALANSRCFTIMARLRSTPYDSCAKNVINDFGGNTLGNILCQKMARFYRNDPPEEVLNTGIKIGFYHSECESDWTPTGNPGSPLKAARPLCCIRDEEDPKNFLQVKCQGPKEPIRSCAADNESAPVDPIDEDY